MIKLKTYFTLLSGSMLVSLVSCDSMLTNGLNNNNSNVRQPQNYNDVKLRAKTFEDSTWVDSIINDLCGQKIKFAEGISSDTIRFNLISASQPLKPDTLVDLQAKFVRGDVVQGQNGAHSRTIQFLPPAFYRGAYSGIADTLHYTKDAWYLCNGQPELHLMNQLLFRNNITDTTLQIVYNNIGLGENVKISKRWSVDCNVGNITLLKCEPTFKPIPKGSYYITHILVTEQAEILGFQFSTHTNNFSYLRA